LVVIVVSDTSPLCNLAIIQHLWLLHAIYDVVIIPSVVADELANGTTIPEIPNILTLDWVRVFPLADRTVAEALQRDRRLDPGEAHAIALAIQLQASDLLIDERIGRREATALGVSVIGILGILRVAKQRNLIPEIKPVLDQLIGQAGFRVSKVLYDQTLQDVNE
jgi:uncharacterized protein